MEIIRRNVRALRLTVSIDSEVRCIAPLRASDADIEAFINAHREWIERTLKKMEQRRAACPPLRYITGERHLLWGRQLLLATEEERGRESAAFYDDQIILYCHPDSDIRQRKKVLYQGYYRLFVPELRAMVEKWRRQLSAPEITLSVRLMRTEWGSCTPRKHRMTFNIDLVRLPRECMEYVVIHEFTHLDHPNHSAAFWALCDRRLASAGLPDSKTMRKKLKTIGRSSNF